jgi:hypothetical protein
MKQARAILESKLNSSACWFYWIAILAAIQGDAIAFKLGDVSFIGLGVTRVIDQAARAFLSKLGAKLPLSLSVLSMTGTLVVSGIFALCGYLGVRRHFWIYMIGIVLYVLDAAVCILVKDYIPLVFHAGALIALLSGPGLITRLKEMDNRDYAGVTSLPASG